MRDVARYRQRSKRPGPPRGGRGWPRLIGAALLIGAGVAWAGYSYVGVPMSGCDIKGNISVNTGERIYHVPGQTYYSETRIDLLKGERWFCTEQDARAAGWRRSRV
jgi:hypothetical protein